METAERIRKDSRSSSDLRPISVKVGVINSADGSAEFSLGQTKVLAVVHGPVATKSRYEQIDRATLKVTVESFNSAPSLKDVAMAQKLENILHAVIFDLLHPRSLVSIVIQPISLDGSYFAVAFNAAIAALLDSSFPMTRMAFASSCLIDSYGSVLLDSDASEESEQFSSEHLVIYDPEDLKKSLAMNHFGKFNFEDISKITPTLIDMGIFPIAEEIQNVIRKKIETF